MTLTLLHTSPAHIATFDALRDRVAPGTPLAHQVREDFLSRAQGGIGPALASEITAAIATAGDSVLCTCTTIGAVAEAAGAIRIDRPVLRQAARTGGRVMLAYCLQSTAAPSLALLGEEMEKAANSAGIEPLFIAEAWPLFEAGALAAFATTIAETIRNAAPPDIGCIVLAQASMAPAAALLPGLPVLSSPEPALRAALGHS